MERYNQAWMHYVKNIVAADVSSAVFLASHLRQLAFSRDYLPALEVIDLQRYKVISSRDKVRIALSNRSRLPFVFVVGKN